MPIAVGLSLFTIAYNCIEGGVSIAIGLDEESLGLVGFGVDSFVEVLSACFVLLRLYPEIKKSNTDVYTSDHDKKSLATRSERISTIGIGCLLLALSLGAVVTSIVNFAGGVRPDTAIPGIVVSILSLLIMFFIWYAKVYASIMLDSNTLEKDAACSLGCIKLSFVLLLGSALFAAGGDSFWWADSTAGLLIGLFVGWEGYETVVAAMREDFDGCVCCSRGNSWLYSKLYAKLRSRCVRAFVCMRRECDGKMKVRLVQQDDLVEDARRDSLRISLIALSCSALLHASLS